MASLEDFQKRVKELEAQARLELPQLAKTLAISAKALSERNIKQNGFGKKYSDEKVPVWFFKGKELNAAGLEYIEKQYPEKGKIKIKKLEDITERDLADGRGNWGEFRKAQGLQSDHVDFSYTNKTWQAMVPGDVIEQNGVFTCYLAATNEEAQKKMNYGFEMYGDFVKKGLQNGDLKILSDITGSGLKKIIDNSKLIR